MGQVFFFYMDEAPLLFYFLFLKDALNFTLSFLRFVTLGHKLLKIFVPA
jgi:hypothetical protein